MGGVHTNELASFMTTFHAECLGVCNWVGKGKGSEAEDGEDS